MSFHRRLQQVLSEAGPRIVDARLLPHRDGYQRVAWALYQDGSSEALFRYDPAQLQFTAQELIGLDRRAARYLHDKKLDDAMGFSQF